MKKFSKLFVLAVLVLQFLTVAVFAQDYETIPNERIQDSSELSAGIVMAGALSDESDVDWFKIETSSSGDILFKFEHDGDGVYTYYWYAEVLDANERVINSGNLSGKDMSEFSATGLNAGTYYLKISKAQGGNPFMNGFSSAEYRITATTRCLAHPAQSDWLVTKEPTCLEAGERVKKCTLCEAVVETEPVSKLEHSYSEWEITEKPEFLKAGKRQKVCVLCGRTVERSVGIASTVIALLIIGVVFLYVIGKISKKSAPPVRSTSGVSSPLSGGRTYSETSTTYIPPSTSSESSWDDVADVAPDGVINIDGELHDVYTTDAEGYSTGPYIEDAEGYKTAVDPDDVQDSFNWLDL